jgi:hypothetical protein
MLLCLLVGMHAAGCCLLNRSGLQAVPAVAVAVCACSAVKVLHVLLLGCAAGRVGVCTTLCTNSLLGVPIGSRSSFLALPP